MSRDSMLNAAKEFDEVYNKTYSNFHDFERELDVTLSRVLTSIPDSSESDKLEVAQWASERLLMGAINFGCGAGECLRIYNDLRPDRWQRIGSHIAITVILVRHLIGLGFFADAERVSNELRASIEVINEWVDIVDEVSREASAAGG